MSAGEFVMRHLWCCLANGMLAGSCGLGTVFPVPYHLVLQALLSLTASERHDAYTFARMGPDPKHPYTGLCCLARRRGLRPSQLRERATTAAHQLARRLAA